MPNVDLNWKELGFSYHKTNTMFISRYKDGAWDEGRLTEDDILPIEASATALHYGQQCFEGMKAYRTEDGRILLFRPDMNAKRINRSCERLLMPKVDEDFFIESVKKVVKDNEDFIPPYGSGGSLYIRPFIIGVGHNMGVKPAPEYLFCILVTPVGAYFKGGMQPVNFITTDYDRAAPHGTGAAKVGGNYAASLLPHQEAVEQGFADCIYLDPKTGTKIEEVGAANFFGITDQGEFITPESSSILESITRLSLLEVAKDLGLEAKQEDVYIDQLHRFIEAGACGTAAVITPIGAICHKGDKTIFHSETEVGEKTKALYERLTGIQYGEVEDTHGWTVEVK